MCDVELALTASRSDIVELGIPVGNLCLGYPFASIKPSAFRGDSVYVGYAESSYSSISLPRISK